MHTVDAGTLVKRRAWRYAITFTPREAASRRPAIAGSYRNRYAAARSE
jgi:hypothetical protein